MRNWHSPRNRSNCVGHWAFRICGSCLPRFIIVYQAMHAFRPSAPCIASHLLPAQAPVVHRAFAECLDLDVSVYIDGASIDPGHIISRGMCSIGVTFLLGAACVHICFLAQLSYARLPPSLGWMHACTCAAGVLSLSVCLALHSYSYHCMHDACVALFDVHNCVALLADATLIAHACEICIS